MWSVEINDFKSKEEVINFLVEFGYVDVNSIVVWKFLREDLTLNLELLELAVEYFCSKHINFYISFDNYFETRGKEIQGEKEFILGFIKSLVEEYSE